MDGVLNLYKPPGPTSFSMVRSVKEILNVGKAGHIGTLDPIAEGVLPIGLNKSTKAIPFLTRLSKVYTGVMLLGAETDTQDATGKVLSQTSAAHIDEDMVRTAAKEFEGDLQQVPPMFSAKKKNGVPLYKLARNGITIKRDPVSLRIHSLRITRKNGGEVAFQVHCSAGTYVRTLCHDIGAKLGCGAHLLRLVRTQVGYFNLENSITLDEVKVAESQGTLSEKIFTLEKVLDFLPELQIKEGRAKIVSHGTPLSKSFLETLPEPCRPGMKFRVINGDNRLIAVVESLIDKESFARLEPDEIAFKPNRVFA